MSQKAWKFATAAVAVVTVALLYFVFAGGGGGDVSRLAADPSASGTYTGLWAYMSPCYDPPGEIHTINSAEEGKQGCGVFVPLELADSPEMKGLYGNLNVRVKVSVTVKGTTSVDLGVGPRRTMPIVVEMALSY